MNRLRIAHNGKTESEGHMTDLSTTYMGVKLANPIIVGACGLTSNMRTIQEIAASGAGALVTKSLFEEQIQLERFRFDENLEKYNYRHAEMIEVFAHTVYDKPKEHLQWVRKAKQSVEIPVFASLNAVNKPTWIEYARLLAETGVDGLEINLFASPRDPELPAGRIEDEQVELVTELKRAVSIPISIKLSSFYTNVLQVVGRMDRAGADAFVLFNRLFEPDIDLTSGKLSSPFGFSRETDSRLPLRYAALLEGTVKADLCCSTGIITGEQAVKMLLAGARAVQVVSALYEHGIPHIRTLVDGISQWMSASEHKTLADFRGRFSKRHVADPLAYTRAQYAKLLMNPDALVQNAPVV